MFFSILPKQNFLIQQTMQRKYPAMDTERLRAENSVGNEYQEKSFEEIFAKSVQESYQYENKQRKSPLTVLKSVANKQFA